MGKHSARAAELIWLLESLSNCKKFKKLKAKRTLKGNLVPVCKFFVARFQIAEDCSKQRQKKIQYLGDQFIQILTGDKEQD